MLRPFFFRAARREHTNLTSAAQAIQAVPSLSYHRANLPACYYFGPSVLLGIFQFNA